MQSAFTLFWSWRLLAPAPTIREPLLLVDAFFGDQDNMAYSILDLMRKGKITPLWTFRESGWAIDLVDTEGHVQTKPLVQFDFNDGNELLALLEKRKILELLDYAQRGAMTLLRLRDRTYIEAEGVLFSKRGIIGFLACNKTLSLIGRLYSETDPDEEFTEVSAEQVDLLTRGGVVLQPEPSDEHSLHP